MDYKIVVDAGHGGSDPGAINGNIKEKDFTLEAALYMYDRFNDLGVPVAITRDTDRTLTRSERLSTMTDTFGNDENVIVLSNHINAGGVAISNYQGLNINKYNVLFPTHFWHEIDPNLTLFKSRFMIFSK